MKTRRGGSLASAKQIPADQSEPLCDVKNVGQPIRFHLTGAFYGYQFDCCWYRFINAESVLSFPGCGFRIKINK